MREFCNWAKNLFAVVLVIGLSAAIVFLLCNHFWYINQPIGTNLNSCVFVGATNGSGSGIVFRNNDKVFIWTCYHVIADNVEQKICIDVANKTLDYKFHLNRIKIKSKIFNAALEESGFVSIDANIIRFSASDDLAVIEVLEPRVFNQSVRFPRNTHFIPQPGTQVFHIGCMLGWHGFNGCSDGIVGLAGVDLDENGKIFDKIQAAFHFGSSGGGVFESTTGQCIGLVARSNDRTAMSQGYIIPYRRMVEFALRLDCMWALSNESISSDYLSILTDDKLDTDIANLVKKLNQK